MSNRNLLCLKQNYIIKFWEKEKDNVSENVKQQTYPSGIPQTTADQLRGLEPICFRLPHLFKQVQLQRTSGI